MEIGISSSKNKIKIYADGEFLFTVPAALWYSSRFHEGDDVSEQELMELKKQAELSLAFDSAMRMLSLRAHSEYELRHKLWQKFPPDAVNAAIEKLHSLDLLDDEKFALLYAFPALPIVVPTSYVYVSIDYETTTNNPDVYQLFLPTCAYMPQK